MVQLIFLKNLTGQEVLQELIEQALTQSKKNMQKLEEENLIKECFNALTPREKQVLSMLTSGAVNTPNKKIAEILGISPRTVEDHRAKNHVKDAGKIAI